MIKLFQFPSSNWGLPNASLFCMKLETYLRMVKLPFEIVKTYNPRRSPKGKLPYIEDNGKTISDSGIIINYLKKTYGDPLDGNLSALQQAQSLALRRLIEEHLYWAIFYSRWADPAFWPIAKRAFFRGMTGLKKEIAAVLIRKNMRAELRGQGLGRHSIQEVYDLGIEDLSALATILNAQPFIFGTSPTSIDACAYAAIANILVPPIESPLKAYAKSQPCFISYYESMKNKFYG